MARSWISAAACVSVLRILSPREREVAELVAAGRSNRELADALVISGRTVERHMENIFRKLEVRSRTAVAAAVAPVAR